MLYNKLKSHRIILASRSPRRQLLLTELGLEYEIMLPDSEDESYPPSLKGYEIPVFLSKAKASTFTNKLSEKDILITADTIVYCNDEVMGKPFDRNDAIAMIEKLSGKDHFVYTGVSLTSAKKQITFYSETKVHFRLLQKDEIEYYVDTCKPFDKAGAYGVQEWIGYTAIDRIEGSYFNVVGLPIDKLWVELEKFIA